MADTDQVIAEAREHILEVNTGLAKFLTARVDLVELVGHRKAELDLPVVNGQRDQEVLDHFYAQMQAQGYTGTRELPDAVMGIILTDSKARQEAIKEAYQTLSTHSALQGFLPLHHSQ